MNLKNNGSVVFVNLSQTNGGAEHSLLTIIKELECEKCVVSIGEGDFSRAVEETGCQYHSISNNSEILEFNREDGLIKLIKLIFSIFISFYNLLFVFRRFDIVYCNNYKSLFLSLPCAYLLRRKCIVHVRDVVSSETYSRLSKNLFRISIKLFSPFLIFNSEATKKSVESMLGGLDGFDHELIFNGIDESENFLGVQRSEEMVLSVGKVSSGKGQVYLVEAFIKILKIMPNFKLFLVGGFSNQESKYYRQIIEIVERNGAQDNIKFTGNVSDVEKYYREATLFVHPAIVPESFGRVLIEAMLYGAPVIATGIGAAREIIKDKNNGLLINPESVDDIYKSILFLIENPEYAEKIKRVAYDYAKNNFGVNKLIIGISNVINKLMEKK